MYGQSFLRVADVGWLNLLELLASCLSLVAYTLITSGKRYGFLLGLMASVMGLVLFLGRDMYGMAGQQMIFVGLNLRALWFVGRVGK